MPRRSAPPDTPPKPGRSFVGLRSAHLFEPTAERPVRGRMSRLQADTEVVPHRHPWAQVSFSASGVVRLTTAQGTYLAPPSRLVWVPPAVEHAVTVVEDAELRTVYLREPPAPDAVWQGCRVLEVSALLRALILEFSLSPDGGPPLPPDDLDRERLLAALLHTELARAPALPIGVPLPTEKRLRALCEAVLDDPGRHATLEGWAAGSGASPRTLARLFREELGTSFGQWRQQAVLARAATLAARRTPIAVMAADLGYASASAFTAMVRRAVGQPPRQFFGS